MWFLSRRINDPTIVENIKNFKIILKNIKIFKIFLKNEIEWKKKFNMELRDFLKEIVRILEGIWEFKRILEGNWENFWRELREFLKEIDIEFVCENKRGEGGLYSKKQFDRWGGQRSIFWPLGTVHARGQIASTSARPADVDAMSCHVPWHRADVATISRKMAHSGK